MQDRSESMKSRRDNRMPSFTRRLLAVRTGGLTIGSNPDCDEQPPSPGSVTAMLNRLIRTATAVRGVQCPIPPIPDLPTTQEPHP